MNAWPNLFFFSCQKEDWCWRSRCDLVCTNVLEVHALFFPIADGDDTLAFAIPLEVIAVFQSGYSFSRSRGESKTGERKRSHIFPEMTLNSPLSV
jgi:hypothetical protein